MQDLMHARQSNCACLLGYYSSRKNMFFANNIFLLLSPKLFHPVPYLLFFLATIGNRMEMNKLQLSIGGK